MPFYCLNNISATLKFLAASRWAARPPTSRRQTLGRPAANFTPPAAGPPATNCTPLDHWAANFTHLKFCTFLEVYGCRKVFCH
jgi:hypothetical protein